MPGLERVTESFSFSGGTVDESGPYPVIRGVVICGLESVHGYGYDPAACWAAGKAKAVYEGLWSYAGHGAGERDPHAKLAWWENVRTRPDGRPEGDYCLNPEHLLCKSVVWAAKHKPDFYTMSHVADVRKVKRPDGRVVVESIGKAHSIDLVCTGGTTGGLFESAHKGATNVPTTVKEYTKRLGAKCDVGQLLKLHALVKEDGFGDAPMPADAPDPAADATSGQDGVDAAFVAAAMSEVQACVDAKSDKALVVKCLGKLKKLLMAHGEIKAIDDSDTSEDDGATDPTAKESGKGGKAKPASPPDPWVLLKECGAQSYKPTETDLTALKGMADAKGRTAFILQQKALHAASSPASVSRQQVAATVVQESGTGNGGNKAAAEGDWLLQGIPGAKK